MPSLRSLLWRAVLKRTFKRNRLSVDGYRLRALQTASYVARIPSRDGTRVEETVLGGVRAAWILPPRPVAGTVILHFHGGGYVIGTIETQLMMCLPMAKALGLNVLVPEYRLAPEHPFPAALEDALEVYRALLASGREAGTIVVSGDSAGGGLALAFVLSLRDSGEPLPAALVCMSPWTDLSNRSGSHAHKAKSEAILRTEVLDHWAACYAGKVDLGNPLVSPLHADFRAFPPILIQVGSEEILLDDSLLLARKAREAGVSITLSVWRGMWHVWPALGNLVPETTLAFEETARFLCDHGIPAGRSGRS